MWQEAHSGMECHAREIVLLESSSAVTGVLLSRRVIDGMVGVGAS